MLCVAVAVAVVDRIHRMGIGDCFVIVRARDDVNHHLLVRVINLLGRLTNGDASKRIPAITA